MTNKYLALAVGACAVIFAASGANAQTTLKFGHYNAESHPMHKAAVQFKENVEKRTNGAVKIQIYPNNTLGSPPEILEQTRNGVVDIAVPTSGQLDKYDKAFAALMLPFVFDDIDHARRAMDGAAAAVVREEHAAAAEHPAADLASRREVRIALLVA